MDSDNLIKSGTCELKQTPEDGKTKYYYDDCAVSETITGLENANKIDEGTIEFAQINSENTKTKGDLTLTGITKSNDTTTSHYYYLVVEYVDTNKEQNADMGVATITAQITGVESASSTIK